VAESTDIHLSALVSTMHASQTWCFPGSWQNYPYYGNAELLMDVARTLERGSFDLAFFADTGGTQGTDENLFEAITWGTQWPRHEPFPLAMAMAMATTHLGVGITFSTTYQHPFHTARLFNSADHVTGGRVAWNAVTSAYTNEAANWGYSEMPSHEWRYQRANEHIEVVKKLWDSVDADALVFNRVTGQLMDPSKVRRVDHHGEHFDVAGPLPCTASPQGSPPILQAGMSPAGMALAAKHADCQFGQGSSLEAMIDYRRRLDAALAVAGRKPRDVGVLWAVRVDVVSGPEEAAWRERAYFDAMPDGHDMLMLSQMFSVDFTRFSPETKFHDVAGQVKDANTNWGYLQDAVMASDPDITVRDYARQRILQSVPTARGTAQQVADQLEYWHEATGRNGGFMFCDWWQVPAQVNRVVDELVPELRRRSLVRTGYRSKLLRDNLLI
jgi:long-chain alkane monooxygenase